MRIAGVKLLAAGQPYQHRHDTDDSAKGGTGSQS
jgi:hypothetical protein